MFAVLRLFACEPRATWLCTYNRIRVFEQIQCHKHTESIKHALHPDPVWPCRCVAASISMFFEIDHTSYDANDYTSYENNRHKRTYTTTESQHIDLAPCWLLICLPGVAWTQQQVSACLLNKSRLCWEWGKGFVFVQVEPYGTKILEEVWKTSKASRAHLC